jgi:hypothetical protein
MMLKGHPIWSLALVLPDLCHETLCPSFFVLGFATISTMSQTSQLYCPKCAKPVTDPLSCGDCGSVICRVCGTPLESSDELAIG